MPDAAPATIRFHLDEQMDPDIATALRKVAIDVTTTQEQRLLGAADESQFQYACESRRVIVTDDTDLLTLAAASPDHPGVVYCRRTTLSGTSFDSLSSSTASTCRRT